MSKLYASLVCASLLLGCDSSPSQPIAGIPFTTLAATKVSGSAGPQIQTVIRSEAAWRQVWSELWAGQEPALPAVDFSRDLVVLVTASEICFGGAEIEQIVHDGNDLQIRYGDAASSLCLCVQPELSFHAVRATQALGEARFEARETPALCPTSS